MADHEMTVRGGGAGDPTTFGTITAAGGGGVSSSRRLAMVPAHTLRIILRLIEPMADSGQLTAPQQHAYEVLSALAKDDHGPDEAAPVGR